MSSVVLLSQSYDDRPWGDIWVEENYTDSLSTIAEEAVSDDEGWSVVNSSNKSEVKPVVKPWCTYGNACSYTNCRGRHEVCEHHAKWLANGKTGYSCRSLRDDPLSCKSPMHGGCKYDHRDHSKLQNWVEHLPCSTEVELWESFGKFGLEATSSLVFDTSEMKRCHKGLLFASLKHYNIDFYYDELTEAEKEKRKREGKPRELVIYY